MKILIVGTVVLMLAILICPVCSEPDTITVNCKNGIIKLVDGIIVRIETTSAETEDGQVADISRRINAPHQPDTAFLTYIQEAIDE